MKGIRKRTQKGVKSISLKVHLVDRVGPTCYVDQSATSLPPSTQWACFFHLAQRVSPRASSAADSWGPWLNTLANPSALRCDIASAFHCATRGQLSPILVNTQLFQPISARHVIFSFQRLKSKLTTWPF